MASSKEYLTFIPEQLSGLEDVSYRAMMGEYILYYKGKIVGDIYGTSLDQWLQRVGIRIQISPGRENALHLLRKRKLFQFYGCFG